ncbi:dynamin-like 120 kDa protein, mitochondrial isoform X2 [Rhopilema esculentum]|uniref:dynamin-like 120 kDa protein, mitochondrial isoform X2 n=1 Tax=Rhopilema esculentum TaxID=499914 RepID=UPI0031E13522
MLNVKVTSGVFRRCAVACKTSFCVCQKAKPTTGQNVISRTIVSKSDRNRQTINILSRASLQRSQTYPILGVVESRRQIGMFFLRAVRHFAKLRYLILGGVGTSVMAAKMEYNKRKDQWNEFIDGMPSITWLKDYLEVLDKVPSVSDKLPNIREKMKDFWTGLDSYLNKNSVIDVSKSIFQKKANENEISLQEAVDLQEVTGRIIDVASDVIDDLILAARPSVVSAAIFGEPENDQERRKDLSTEDQQLRDHLARAQSELIEMQQKFQREIDRLEQENRELRKQLMSRGEKVSSNNRKIKRSLIDMYSDVLDLLSEYDASYNVQDHLPRVVVVGDQSAGKTSVLEMIARARIFPRGAGEMMTRCPIMVTLSEGPNHVACFKGATKEFDLTDENELRRLRAEIEIKMKSNLKEGQTVSTDVISMYVKGPGIPRMVLVDLPGTISTETTGMGTNTKKSIMEVTRYYMSNPNAIILCVQDGSVDAERSIVTETVSSCDPSGKRTIFVLTKTDVAESNEANPSRIKQILSGKLFPMKAMGYFAVVSGTGNTSDSISAIRQYEEDFFRNSKLFKSGTLKASQMTTQNLSFAVANCFWNMVRESIEQQADTFKARKFNLETEWRNNYSSVRELDRDELYDKARGQILDEVLSLGQIKPHEWEQSIYANLWDALSPYAFENIFLPSAQTNDPVAFRTEVDILLKQWVERSLPDSGVQVGWQTLLDEFARAMEEGVAVGGRKDGHSVLFKHLKAAVKHQCEVNHAWQASAHENLRVIQRSALEDTNVPDKQQWDNAIKFMENTLLKEEDKTQSDLNSLIGPGWQERWMYWTYRNSEQHVKNEIKKELDRLLQADSKHRPELAEDEITTVRKNLQTNNIEAAPSSITDTWKTLYRLHFLKQSLEGVMECRKAYYHRELAKSDLQCNDVVLFWRVQKMLQSTSNALRQQVMNIEGRRLENEVKQILFEMGQNQDEKKKLLNGRQVDLAEELKRVRHIQLSLEQFIEALKREKN